MIYMEYIFVCMIAPLLIAIFMLKGEARRFIGFFILGIAACLLSAYINSFVAVNLNDQGHVSLTFSQMLVQVTPVLEEMMKALPVFFFIALVRPGREDIVPVAIAVGLGFATFENIYYITQYGATDFAFALIRGFSAGVMHTICAAILGYGMARIYERKWIVLPGALALICAASTFHAIYNLLSSSYGAWRTAGYILPLACAAALLIWYKHPKAAE